MPNPFFDRPILNNPYQYPQRHWELDANGQPDSRTFWTPGARPSSSLPSPKAKKTKAEGEQETLVFDEGEGLSTKEQQYELTSAINSLRGLLDEWRALKNPANWLVTPETARLLQHWRHHEFSNLRPFFCQVEAVETAIWLTEVAPQSAAEAHPRAARPRE